VNFAHFQSISAQTYRNLLFDVTFPPLVDTLYEYICSIEKCKRFSAWISMFRFQEDSWQR